MGDVKFFIKSREVALMRQVRKAVRIDVYSHNSSSKNSLNSLKHAFNDLLNKGIYSDLEIVVNGEIMKAHKCILIARSDKFKSML